MKPSPETRQAVILDSIADGVFTVDKDWRISSFNRAAEEITGIPRKEAVGQLCWEVFRGDICEHHCALKQSVSTGKALINRTVNIVNSRGRKIPISVSTAILKDDKGRAAGEVQELKKELLGKYTLSDIVTNDPKMRRIFDIVPAIATSEAAVLILGESGTGKELLARAIHSQSHRANGPFVAVNCGALPEHLLESELFGYKKGAFTDAKTDKLGRFDRAKGGTLFLDEVGDLPKPLQVKLLRVLQEKTYEPLGAVAPVKADVRIITATNRDISRMAREGGFRKDLYYRISVIPITLPPLREKRNDIPLLIDHFLGRLNAVHQKNVSQISEEAMALVLRHDFPGNVRELENIIEHAFVLCGSGRIEKEHLPEELSVARASGTPQEEPETVHDFERKRILAALQKNKHNRRDTARTLGIDTSTLWRKMKRLGIT